MNPHFPSSVYMHMLRTEILHRREQTTAPIAWGIGLGFPQNESIGFEPAQNEGIGFQNGHRFSMTIRVVDLARAIGVLAHEFVAPTGR